MVDTPIPVKKSASPNWYMKGKGAGTELDASEAYVVDSIAEAGIGGLTDAAASASTDEDTTSRSMIALMKGQKNLLIDIQSDLLRKIQLHANIDISQATAYTAIAAPGAGYRLRICQILLMSGASAPINSEVAIKSGSTIIKTVKGASIALDFPEHCNLGTNEALVLLPTTADRIVGGVDYYLEAV